MKNFNKLFSGLILAFGALITVSLVRPAMGSVVARMPKEVFSSSATTGLVSVTPAISSNAVASAAFMPGAVYQVNMSTGAASEYFELWDSTTATGITCTGGGSGGPNQQMIEKFLFSSTSANVVYTLDPPAIFHNGLVVCDSAVTGQVFLTYELGRGLSGQ